jgi:hypothetical protein
MANYTERVFIVGGTGNIDVKTVNDLLAKKVAVTLYARSPSKIASLFPTDANLNTVQGDFNDLSALKEGIKGHTRLFLLVTYRILSRSKALLPLLPMKPVSSKSSAFLLFLLAVAGDPTMVVSFMLKVKRKFAKFPIVVLLLHFVLEDSCPMLSLLPALLPMIRLLAFLMPISLKDGSLPMMSVLLLLPS